MPPPPRELDSLSCVCGGGGGDGDGESKVVWDGGVLPGCDTEEERDDPYAPAESLRLRIGEDIDWSDVAAAAVLERDDSTKGAGANPKSAARRSVATARSSLSSTAPPRAVAVVIGGLPPVAAPGKAIAREHSGGRRRSPCRLGGRARVSAAGESAVGHDHPPAEPTSPKVSCLGGVRSDPTRHEAEGRGGRRRRPWRATISAMCCCWN